MIESRQIESIVADVLARLEGEHDVRPGMATPLGVHATLDDAVAAGRRAFDAFQRTPLATRNAIIASIRAILTANWRTLAELAVSETGLGRVEDKILKNQIVTEKTPGTEDLEPVT